MSDPSAVTRRRLHPAQNGEVIDVMNPTRPALRCIPEAAEVARLLGEAARTRIAEARPEAQAAPPAPEVVAAE